MLQTVIVLLATGSLSLSALLSPPTNLQAEIERANTESQELAEELSGLLELLQSDKEITLADNIFTDILLRIQEIAQAAEQENLIRLSETVKGKRMEEEELTQSINDLQNLGSLLENRGKK